ncbi:MAG: S-layer homology domain-containing protein [Candidatus Margulisbacteria bacterium]|nr:S-layer homology domain-containing protein [Candidatus Margulisiibacteriota bacterium]
MAAIIIFIAPAWAQLAELGINPLDIDLGARPLGMGGAFTGLADDMNALIYNPGGLAWAKGISATVKDIENIGVTQAYPTGYGSSLGLGVIARKISTAIPSGIANSSGNVIYLSFGTKLNFIPALFERPFFNRLGVGINFKGLSGQTLRKAGVPDRSASGWDADFGLLWKAADWWSAGLVVQNFLPAGALGGGKIKWDVGGEEGVPAIGKLAGSARVIGDIDAPIFMEGREVVVAGELDFFQTQPTLLRIGGEYKFNERYYLRTGFMQQHGRNGVSSDITFGAGIRFDRFGIDFASYNQAIQEERFFVVSVLYFPKEWIVVEKLEFEKPGLFLETAFEKISLEDNIVTSDDEIEVSGRVKPGVEVYIDGLRASLDEDNSFKVLVPLHMKKNLIVVEARYEGEKKIWKYKVFRKARVDIADEAGVANLEEKIEAVESLVTMGVIEITPEADFVMEAGITRGELASWIVKAAELRLPKVSANLYPDVPWNHPLAPYIKVVTDLKLFEPFADGTFRPDAVVSEEEGNKIFASFDTLK